MNYFRTALLLAGLTALFMGVGFLIGGKGGALIALVIAAGMNLFTYWNSDRMVLSMYGAHQVDQRSAPDLYNLVAELASRAQLPMPRVFIMDEAQPNAFATGRNPDNAAVAVTQTVYGAYEKQGELNGAHFEIEDDGVLPNGGTDGGHHNEATAAMANMAIMAH